MKDLWKFWKKTEEKISENFEKKLNERFLKFDMFWKNNFENNKNKFNHWYLTFLNENWTKIRIYFLKNIS